MYVKINNDVLTDFADWEFQDSQFVDIDYKEFVKYRDRFSIKNNQIIDLVQSEEYINKKRIEEIKDELDKLDELYYLASQTPIEFEGHIYKFEWTSLYQGLLQSGILPAKIWDMTELEENAVVMDEETLRSLQNRLLEFQESAFQTRKEARSLLLFEKISLENTDED
ncbi:hypothetical protein IJS77_03090 [bacterium]|nr:hypothetical protein [bacterium]